MIADEHLKFAAEDARSRHTALLQLIYFNEQQAMSLLRLYVTVGVAAGSGAFAKFPFAVAAGLFCVAVTMTFGAAFCLFAMRSSEVDLPGRGADFWLWADQTESVDYGHAMREYLRGLSQASDKLRTTNRVTGRWLKMAKRTGAITIPAGVLVSTLAASKTLAVLELSLGF